MKRIFPVILILVTFSLLGIIFIQLSWLNNMVALRKDQVEEKVLTITSHVAEELAQYKGLSSTTGLRNSFPDNEEFFFDKRSGFSISQRFTTRELYDKIHTAFAANKIENIPFEFALASFRNEGIIGQFERQSANFQSWYEDTLNYYPKLAPIIPPSGSAAENLAAEEWIVIVVPNVTDIVYKSLRLPIFIAILFTLVICTAFYLTLRTMLRQKKISEIKNDFINNMTHEFKTPISTISLAVDAIRNEKVQRDVEKLLYFSDIIKEENQRMNRQVETILKSALMDRQEVQLNQKPLHVHTIIKDVADNFILRLQEKQGALNMNLAAQNDLISGDEVHISNLVNNLMDNAVKYSKEGVPPKILLTTSSNAKSFFIKIEDNGIGMTKETVKRIFEKFYRAHTGNIHNVKGFGLGLSYVKTVVDAHDGHIKADSTLGKGSCFTIELKNLTPNPSPTNLESGVV
ncbi:MAG: HAMP domain-containing sensor histidine kinase [Bacteroidota bacterium]